MNEFRDIMVIYQSVDDVEPNLWVAHSVRTDQVGVGHDPIEAVRELALAVRTLLEEAAKDPRVRIEQPAPVDVLQRLPKAKELPPALLKRVRDAMFSCQHHDTSYWSPTDGDDVDSWEDDEAAGFYGTIEQGDLCPA